MAGILIVDDHAVVRAALRHLVASEEGLEPVGEAGSAGEAVVEAATLQPDVILLDVTMPGRTGIDALPDLRAAAPGARVVVLSMEDDPRYVQDAFARGADAYVSKDSAETEVIDAIRAVLAGRRYVAASLGALLATGPADGAREPALTPREQQVLRLLALGHTNQEIATTLGISVRTAETHRGNVFEKLGLASRADLVRYALDHGLLDDVA